MDKFRVMIVDDDPDIRFVVSNLLKPAFEAVEAENGLDALEKVERYEPDVMLLDVNMPIMNGFRCCEGMRRHPQYHRMPVFFLSGFGDRTTYAEAYGSGATAYLEKPIDTTQLVELIQTHIREKRLQPTSKTFSVEELQVVDRTPLRVADGGGEETGPGGIDMDSAETRPPFGDGTEPAKSAPPETGEAKPVKRRVFGRGAREPVAPPVPPQPTAPPPAPPPPPAPAVSPVPPPPAKPVSDGQPAPIQPRYGRVERPRATAGPGGLRDLVQDERKSETRGGLLDAEGTGWGGRTAGGVRSGGIPGMRESRGAQASEGARETRETPGKRGTQGAAQGAAGTAGTAGTEGTGVAGGVGEGMGRGVKAREGDAGRVASKAAGPEPWFAAPPAAVPPAAVPPAVVTPAVVTPAVVTPAAVTPAAVPPAAVPSAAMASPAAPSPAVSAKPPAKPIARIMVVDADPRELVAFAEGIRGRGEFLPLEDPVEAIEHIARFQPEIVFSPVALRGWDGIQLIRMLRSNPRLAHIRALFIADAGEDPVRVRAAERECGYPLIVRPVEGHKVAAMIDRVASSPGFSVRAKRATYGEFVRDVLKKIEKQKELRRKEREQEAHQQHLAGFAYFLATELKDYRPPAEGVADSPIRDYYLS